jgi:hypothetical protein
MSSLLCEAHCGIPATLHAASAVFVGPLCGGPFLPTPSAACFGWRQCRNSRHLGWQAGQCCKECEGSTTPLPAPLCEPGSDSSRTQALAEAGAPVHAAPACLMLLTCEMGLNHSTWESKVRCHTLFLLKTISFLSF